MQKNISYTGVILDQRSKDILKEKFYHLKPDNFEWVCHHMTVVLGELPEDSKSLLHQQATLEVTSFGMDNMTMGVGVTGFFSKNARPHITLAVNRKEGGKPYMTNKIPDSNWKSAHLDEKLTGTIEEVENGVRK